MKEDKINLVCIDIKEFKEEIYPYYLKIFPEDERKPINLIETSWRKKYTKIIKIVNQNVLVGFMILNKVKEKGYAGLDYFAILSEYRNKGFGSKALKILIDMEKENNGIFIEIEKVGLGKDEKENIIREKRKAFYEKIGFRKLNFDLELFQVIYIPYVFSNIPIDEEKVMKEMFDIYETIVGKEKIRINCKVIKNLE